MAYFGHGSPGEVLGESMVIRGMTFRLDSKRLLYMVVSQKEKERSTGS